ncbi:MAG: 5-methylthioadenosine/S-adenosylhomocysteine deaminase [Polaribacter sp.]|jgi:5-methylthioadenosine/S-adenosylhomocysteine deaminase
MSTKQSKPSLQIICADWILPMTAPILLPKEQGDKAHRHNLLSNFAIVIEGAKIIDLIPQESINSHYPNAERTNLGQSILMPGFINAHCHAAMTLLRGVNDNLSLQDWLIHVIYPLEKKFVNDEFVYQGTQHAIAEMLRSGTTCFQDMYFMPDQAAKAVHEAGIRANIGLMVVENKTNWANDAQDCINKGLKVRDDFKQLDLIDFSFAPHALYTVSESTLKQLVILTNELTINLQIHLHECSAEIRDSLQKYKQRPFELASKLGLLSPQFNTFHMTQLNDNEIEKIAESGTHVIHCPQSNMKLASGVCPVNKLIESGVNLAIGTDGAASNNDLDMLAEIQTAVWLSSRAIHDKFETSGNVFEDTAIRDNQSPLTAYQGLYAGTMGGAKALGISDKVGSLEIGKQADFISIDLSSIEAQPVYDPISQVVYSSTRNQVTHVWVAGKCLLDNRQLTTLNESVIIKNTKQWQKKISSYLNNI